MITDEPTAGAFCPMVVAAGEPNQPEFDLGELAPGMELLLPVEVQKHKFTGERVAKNQGMYRAIVKGLAEGLGVRQMAGAFGVSAHTVMCIREREPELVATAKEAFGRQVFRIARLSAERLEEGLVKGTITDGQMPVTYGIATDKLVAWSGQSMPRAEIRLAVSVESVKGMFARLVDSVVDVETTASPASLAAPIVVAASESQSGMKEAKPQ